MQPLNGSVTITDIIIKASVHVRHSWLKNDWVGNQFIQKVLGS